MQKYDTFIWYTFVERSQVPYLKVIFENIIIN